MLRDSLSHEALALGIKQFNHPDRKVKVEQSANFTVQSTSSDELCPLFTLYCATSSLAIASSA
jgi:hypothetical protein